LIKWIEQAIAKVVTLEKELADLRQKYAIANNSNNIALESLKLVTRKVTEAAERSGRAAAVSVIAAKQVMIATMNQPGKDLLISAEEAEIAAEKAAKAARETAELVPAVLQAANIVALSQQHISTIQVSMTSALTAIRAAEAATEASKLAQSAALLASSVTLAAR